MGNTTTSTHKLILTDGGTIKEKTNEAKGLNAELDKAAKTSKTMTQAKDKSGPIMQSRLYDNARAGRGTGAEGRDFANQAQGLGGLVRVYATFAANLFAVSAAYNALSKAADTANMVKGLDQLGAASGRNLGTLAQQLVKATDNAVSLREAMQATAMASSSGMSNKDILRMAEGAKKASQALGVDMTDALSRISRGITKLEPELLDEIGIFVRVDTAARDYARSVGKPVTALTELERRAAFANATLTQVEKKFGDIKIDANPYNQLLASLKDLATEGLNVVNKFLGPLIKGLSESPTALSAALAGIGVVLLRQALPAIGQWREELELNADIAARASRETSEFYESFASSRLEQSSDKQAVALRNANTQIQANIASLNTLGTISSKTNLSKVISAYAVDPNSANLEKVFEASEKRKKYIAKQTGKEISDIKKQQYQEELNLIAQVQASSGRLRDQQKAQAAASAAYAKSTGSAGYFSQGNVLSRISKRAEAASTSAKIVSVAAENARFLGFTDSIVQATNQINKAVSENKISKLGGMFTAARAGAAILTGTLTTLASSIMGIFGWIGMIVAAGSMLLDFFQDNKKEADAASEALKTFEDSIDNVIRTTEYLSKLNPVENMSLQSIQARSNALNDLSDAAQTAIDKVNKEILSRDTSEKITGSISKFFGYGAENELAETLANQVIEAIKLAGTVPGLQEAKNNLINLTGGKTGEALKSAILSSKDLQDKLSKGTKDLAYSAKALNNQMSDLGSSTEALRTARQNLVNSLKSTDPLGGMLDQVTISSRKLTTALEDPVNQIAEILKSVKELSDTGILPATELTNIMRATDALDTLNQRYTTLQTQKENNRLSAPNLVNIQERIDVEKKKGNTRSNEFESLIKEYTNAAFKIRDIEISNQSIDNAAKEISDAIRKEADYIKNEVAIKSFKASGDYISLKIEQAIQKSSILVQRANLGLIAGTPTAVRENAKLDAQEINMQIKATEALAQFALSIYNATDAAVKLAAETTLAYAGGNTPDRMARNNAQSDLRFQEIKQRVAAGNMGTLNEEIAKNPEMADRLRGIIKEMEIRWDLRAKKQELEAQKKAKLKTSEIEERKLLSQRELKDFEDSTSFNINEQKAFLNLKKLGNELTDAEIINAQTNLELMETAKKYGAEQFALNNALADAKKANASKEEEYITAQIQSSTKRFLQEKDILEVFRDRNIELAKEKQLLAITDSINRRDASIAQDSYNALIFANDQESDALELAKSRSLVTEDDYNKKKAGLLISKAELEYNGELAAETKKFLDNTQKYRKILDSTTSNADDREKALYDLQAEGAAYGTLTAEMARKLTAQRASAQALTEETTVMKALRDTALSFTSDFSDALFDATQTGKYDFKDMVDSMINDLARLLLKIQMNKFAIQMMGDASKSGSGEMGFLGGVMKFFGVGGSTTPTPTPTAPTVNPYSAFSYNNEAAKGKAFDAGIEMFAKGGAFTNSIVNSPTLFKFAKGTGLMGEAGPEAIVPLRRDANGNLGVGSAGGSTQIVVNNYSGEKATAKESVDSRGNRRIEVEIGDMVAGEISRVGSSAQSSIKNTFGNKPQLIRR